MNSQSVSNIINVNQSTMLLRISGASVASKYYVMKSQPVSNVFNRSCNLGLNRGASVALSRNGNIDSLSASKMITGFKLSRVTMGTPPKIVTCSSTVSVPSTSPSRVNEIFLQNISPRTAPGGMLISGFGMKI